MPSSSRPRKPTTGSLLVWEALTIATPSLLLSEHGTPAYFLSGTHVYRDPRGRTDGQEPQVHRRTARDDHRRRLRPRAEPGPAAVADGLAGRHRRHRRGRAQGHRAVAARASPDPGARRARRRGPAPVRGGGARVAGLAA